MHRLTGHTTWFASLLLLFFCFFTPGCTTEPVETDLLLPVDFANVPENMVLTDFHTDKIEIKIQATPKLIELVQTQGPRYQADLYTDLAFDPAGDAVSIEPGEYLIPVEKKRIPLQAGIKVLSTTPSYLSVKLEKKIKKSFKIKVPYIGKPANGYRVMDAVAEPSSIELSGPLSLIQSIEELKTKPIDINDVNESFKKKIPLDIEGETTLSKPEQIIIVSVPIKEILVLKTIEEIPITVKNTDIPVSIEPPTITIQVKGPFETLKNSDIMDEIHSFIDLKGLEPGVYARHALINIPVGLIMTKATPQVFTIKIE